MALFSRKKSVPAEVEVETVVETREPIVLPPGPEPNSAGLRTVEDHTSYLLSLVEPLKPFGMSLLDAWDQVVCEDIDSMINVPPNSTSKVDGYAVRAEDLTDEYGSLTHSLLLTSDELLVGGAVRVGPGDVLPKGATAVLPASFAEEATEQLLLLDKVEEGAYLRAAGEHLAIGTRLLSEGERLNDRSIGMLSSAGIDKVLVRPRPRVVVLSTGQDLVDPGDEVHHGENADSNSYMISAAARSVGATVFRVAVRTDDPTVLRHTITDQLIRADLLISTTGGRRGDYEAMAEAMADLGAADSVDVAMSPGRTQTFGLIGDERVPMMMLPGNPVSAYVSFQVFVRPLILRLRGSDDTRRPVRAIATATMRSTLGKLHLLRGELFTDGNIRRVEPITDPYAMAELSRSNALVILDEFTDVAHAGQQVRCWLLDEDE